MKLLLDLFCGAGGCSVGYARSGFTVIGVDNRPMPHYPFQFIHADAFDFLRLNGHLFDAIHASPPCQKYSALSALHPDKEYVDLVPECRDLLIASGKPYVIENVPGAPLLNPVVLCGTMFRLQTDCGAQLRRHRLFETSFPVVDIPKCNHNSVLAVGVYGGGQHPKRRSRTGKNLEVGYYGVRARREVMGIEWMNRNELSQAIPPAYTEFIGKQLYATLT